MPSVRMLSRARPLLVALLVGALALALSACGDGKKKAGATTVNGVADEPLPTPAGAPGSGVTGMPSARTPVASVAQSAEEPAPVALDENGNPIPADSAEPAPPPSSDATASEPTPQDAVAVLRDYYGAINAGDFARSYALWADGGRASGQSPQQFAEGFAQTRGVSVQIGEPGAMGAAAGSRFIEVPVTLDATQRDGSTHHYTGSFTLRRAVVDGATDEQRAWRIASASLREQ